MTKPANNQMTELELCVLGAVWLRGPCSAYAIRKEFSESQSSYWSSSSGSIYPVIRRLLAAKLIAANAHSSDRRGTRDVAATTDGVRALRSWVGGLPEWTGKAALDPIRARMNFLAVLKTADAKRDFIDRAEKNTTDQIDILKRALRQTDDASVEYLTTLGSLYELEGRIRWLAAVRKTLAAKKSG